MTKTYRVAAELTAGELEALQKAAEHVHVHMAHEHPWVVRDAAMTAIGKLVNAAQELPSAPQGDPQELDPTTTDRGEIRSFGEGSEISSLIDGMTLISGGKNLPEPRFKPLKEHFSPFKTPFPQGPSQIGMPETVDHDEINRLTAEMEALPEYRGWRLSHACPGFFCYSHPDKLFFVLFTPDWGVRETLPIEVQDAQGCCYTEHAVRLPLPRAGRTAQKIFNLVRPTLDRLLGSSTPDGAHP